MAASALVYCESEFGKIDGKVANGLARKSGKYKILGIIDSTKVGLDAGEYLDGVKNGIPVFASLDEAARKLGYVPDYFIYGIAPLASFLDESQRSIILAAMAKHMNVLNGLPEFLSEDAEFMRAAIKYRVAIQISASRRREEIFTTSPDESMRLRHRSSRCWERIVPSESGRQPLPWSKL